MRNTLQNQLIAARIAIYNATNDQSVLSKLTQFGYDEARLEEGRQLYEEAITLVHDQQSAYARQYGATAIQWRLYKQCDKVLQKHRKLVRIALRTNRQAVAELKLSSTHPRALSAWLTQAEQFYALLLANPDYLEAISRYNLTVEELQQGEQLLQNVVQAKLQRELVQGEARNATQTRNAAIRALRRWMTEFRELVRLALADTPQYLEKLGISVASPAL